MHFLKKMHIKGIISPSLLALYLDTLLMAIGFFMLVPLLSVYFVQYLKWNASLTGLILSISGFTQNSMKFFCGIIADRIGYKNAILIGVIIRSIGFGLYGFVNHPIGFAVAGVLAGLGGALFHPASYAAYAKLSVYYDSKKIYAIREWLSNIGYIIGPIIGMFLLKYNFTIVCLVSMMMFLLSFIVSFFFLPQFVEENDNSLSFGIIAKVLKGDRSFLLFTILTSGIWAIYVQLYLAVPIRTSMLLEDTSVVAYFYMIGAIVMVILQIPVIQWLGNHLDTIQTIACGSLFLGLGLIALGGSVGPKSIAISVIIFTLGQMVTLPAINGTVAQMSTPSLVASYFGFHGLGLAIGGVLGNTVGGLLYDLILNHPHLRWFGWGSFFIYAVVISTLLLLRAHRFQSSTHTSSSD